MCREGHSPNFSSISWRAWASILHISLSHLFFQCNFSENYTMMYQSIDQLTNNWCNYSHFIYTKKKYINKTWSAKINKQNNRKIKLYLFSQTTCCRSIYPYELSRFFFRFLIFFFLLYFHSFIRYFFLSHSLG